MKKEFSRSIGTLLAVLMGLTLAACTASPGQTFPTPKSTTSAVEYLASVDREEIIANAYDHAERQISRALQSGELTVNDAVFGKDQPQGRKSLTITQVDGSEFVLEGGPSKGTTPWIITYDGKSSDNLPTAVAMRKHDEAALNALGGFLADIG